MIFHAKVGKGGIIVSSWFILILQVPRVFVKGTSIGGNSETTKLFNNGQLQQMVNDCQS